MTNKESIRGRAKDSPIIHAGFSFMEQTGASWEEALELMVDAYADRCAYLEQRLLVIIQSHSSLFAAKRGKP